MCIEAPNESLRRVDFNANSPLHSHNKNAMKKPAATTTTTTLTSLFLSSPFIVVQYVIDTLIFPSNKICMTSTYMFLIRMAYRIHYTSTNIYLTNML